MRRFELEEGTSKKFWEVSTDGPSLTVHFGRIGTAGQTKTKDLDTPDAARDELDKLVREKTKKGYLEVTTGKPAAPPVSSSTATIAAPSAEDAETIAATLKAFDDIKEWLADHGADAILATLNPPATDEALAAVERDIGHSLPLELRAMYRVHDGQRSLGVPDQNTLFPHEFGCFFDATNAARLDNASRFIHPPDGSRVTKNPAQTVPREWFHFDESLTKSSALRPEECSSAWFTFAWNETFLGLVHLSTGRVFRWVKDEGLSFVAESFGAFVVQFADDLWNEKHKLVRDPYADDEPEEDRAWVWAT